MSGNSYRSHAAGVVEIRNVRRSLYTPNYGAPDILFAWLLSNSRAALSISLPPPDATIAAVPLGHNAAMYMAGLLLCDENFTPANVLKTYDHHYIVDFLNETLSMRTKIFMAKQNAASFFTVAIEGKIMGGTYVVLNDVTRRLLATVTEEDLLKPRFFADELPFVCYHAQLYPSIARLNSGLVDEHIELRLSLKVGGENCVVLVAKEPGEKKARAVDPETGETLCSIPVDALKNLEVLVETLPMLLMTLKKSPDR